MPEMEASDWIAVYAAIVATGALFPEVRRWAESGTKLALQAKPNMVIMGSGLPDEEGLVVVFVYNRGTVPAVITTLVVARFPTLWSRIRGNATRMMVVMNPQPAGYPPDLPKSLAPAEQ